MKTLVVYYSLSGNTEGIAQKLREKLGADIERIETVKAYPSDYQTMVSQGEDEVQKGVRPAIKPLKHVLKDYDRIIIGTPTWWYKMAPAVLTFMFESDFKGKIVVPYMTNAGWPGTVIKDMTALAKKSGATVKNAHEFRFDTHNDGTTTGMKTTERELNTWINSLRD